MRSESSISDEKDIKCFLTITCPLFNKNQSMSREFTNLKQMSVMEIKTEAKKNMKVHIVFISFLKRWIKNNHIKICLRRVHILIFKSSNFIRSTMQKTAWTKRLLITIYEIEFPRQVILSYDQTQKKNAQIPVNQWSRQFAHPQKWIRFQGMNIFKSISCQYLML